MKVLLATNHLFRWTGSEVQLSLVGRILKSAGYSTLVYSDFRSNSDFLSQLLGDTIFSSDLMQVKSWCPDVVYLQHHSIAIQIRALFPEIPILHAQLGILPHLEKSPRMDISPSACLPLSEEVMEASVGEQQIFGFSKPDINIFRNIIDDEVFFPHEDIDQLRRLVLYSYKLDDDRLKAIADATSSLDIEVGAACHESGALPYAQAPNIMRMGEIVIASGRGAIEAMFCGKVPLIMANCGDDGLVTPENFHDLMKFNFSGRCHGKRFTTLDIQSQIRAYKKEYGPVLRDMALHYFGRSSRIESVLAVFNKYSMIKPRKFSENELYNIRFSAETYALQRDYARHESSLRQDGANKRMRDDLAIREQRISEMEQTIFELQSEVAKVEAQVALVTELFGSRYSSSLDISKPDRL